MADDTRSRSVFVNCPFDRPYQALFDAIVFAIMFCDFEVRSALEIVDSGELRLAKILALIEGSAFSIHDISMVTLDPATDLPRFNMPIELGIAIGMKHLGRSRLRDHRLLVLDGAGPAARYRYQAFASDLAGTDIKNHRGEPASAITAIREFLAPHAVGPLPGSRAIERARADFEKVLPAMATVARQDMDELGFVDRLRHIAAFLGRAA